MEDNPNPKGIAVTQDEIIEMYLEVSNKLCNGTEWCWAGVGEPLQLFAKLVAEKERERIKQANAPEIERINTHIKELEDAVLDEREACAKLVEDSWMAFSRTPNRRLDITPFPELEYVAKVIRARGQA